MSTGYVSRYDAERARLQSTFETERNELDLTLRDVRILCAAHEDASIDVPTVLPDLTGDETTAQLRERISDCRTLRERLHVEASQARVQQDLAGVREALRVGDRSTGRVRSAAEVLADHAIESAASQVHVAQPSTAVAEKDVQRILARLDPDVADRERDEVLSFAAALLQRPDDARAPRWLDGLRDRVRSASRAAAVRRKERTHARAVLEDLDDHAPEELLRALDAVVRGRRELDPALRAAADHERDEARSRGDAHLVAETIVDVLEELGYDVHREPGPGGRAGVFHRPGWGPYVGVATVDDRRQLQFGLVRTDPAADDDVRDHEMEREWCARLDQVEEALEDAGVGLTDRHRFELTGTPMPMPVDEDLAISMPAVRRRRHTARRRQ